jgi:hypothetical protein
MYKYFTRIKRLIKGFTGKKPKAIEGKFFRFRKCEVFTAGLLKI